MNGEGEIFLPNVSYVVNGNVMYYNPYVAPPNSFTGVVSAISTTTSYRLFGGSTVEMDNIKTMKINDVEVTPLSEATFSTTGENTYYVEVIEPVTNMESMFWGCNSLTSLDLSNFNTSNVTNMYGMFSYCSSLTELKMGGDITKVSSFSYMFADVVSNGTFYYNSLYSYSKIISQLPSTWTAIPCTMVDGVLVPNE